MIARDSFVWYFPPAILLLFLLYGTFEVAHGRVIATVQPLSVIPSPAIPGVAASVLYQGTESNACDGIVHHWIIDSKGTLYSLDDSSVFHPGTDHDPKKIITFVRPFLVPPGISGGVAEYHSEASRWCNSFQQLLYPVRNSYIIKFEVRGTK